MRAGQWLNVAALATWLICALPSMVGIAQGRFTGWPAAIWLGAYLLYGTALILFLGIGSIRPRLGYYAPMALAAVQMFTAPVVIMLPVVHGHSANSTLALLVIIAAGLPYVAPSPNAPVQSAPYATLAPGWIWSILVVLLLTNVALLFAIDRSWTQALTFGISMGGFMLFAAASSFLVRSEAAARLELATANAELLATRALLAENSRAEERLRISRDLHDTLGHHLTALSLQLDVASRLSEGKAADHIRQAHAITRLLLGDVRDVVSRLRETGQLDLVQAIRSLAGEGPAKAGHYDGSAEAGHLDVAIHLDLPATLAVEDVSHAELLLRCVQEIITNTVRHAQARNLWIRLEERPDGIALHAHDDGRGADDVTCGNGLTGMRERFEMYAGHVEFRTGRGVGFEVRGFLPIVAVA
jgi:signal transduction histidine kinase